MEDGGGGLLDTESPRTGTATGGADPAADGSDLLCKLSDDVLTRAASSSSPLRNPQRRMEAEDVAGLMDAESPRAGTASDDPDPGVGGADLLGKLADGVLVRAASSSSPLRNPQRRMEAEDVAGLMDAESPRAGTASDDADLLSVLPDDVLAQILARLHCARAAARSSVLSKSWLGLWRRLPELHFKNMAPDAINTALAQFAGSPHTVEYLEINVPDHHLVPAPRISSWLRYAAELAPRKFVFVATPGEGDQAVVLALPSFSRTRSMYIHLACALDKFEGDLAALEELALCSVLFDGESLLSRCPRLRVMSVIGSIDDIVIRSASLEELHVATDDKLSLLEVNAPNLKEVLLSNYSILFPDENTESAPDISLLVPDVERLSWSCNFRFGKLWLGRNQLRELIVTDIATHNDHGENGDLLRFLNQFKNRRIQKLQLCMDIPRIIDDDLENLIEAIVELPIISILELQMWTEGHCYGPVILHLLSQCNSIDDLLVYLAPIKVEMACSLNCLCDQPKCWRNQTFKLPTLKQVIIENFSGVKHELDLVKVIVRSSPALISLIVAMSDEMVRGEDTWKSILHICKSEGDASCYVYDANRNLIAKS